MFNDHGWKVPKQGRVDLGINGLYVLNSPLTKWDDPPSAVIFYAWFPFTKVFPIGQLNSVQQKMVPRKCWNVYFFCRMRPRQHEDANQETWIFCWCFQVQETFSLSFWRSVHFFGRKKPKNKSFSAGFNRDIDPKKKANYQLCAPGLGFPQLLPDLPLPVQPVKATVFFCVWAVVLFFQRRLPWTNTLFFSSTAMGFDDNNQHVERFFFQLNRQLSSQFFRPNNFVTLVFLSPVQH